MSFIKVRFCKYEENYFLANPNCRRDSLQHHCRQQLTKAGIEMEDAEVIDLFDDGVGRLKLNEHPPESSVEEKFTARKTYFPVTLEFDEDGKLCKARMIFGTETDERFFYEPSPEKIIADALAAENLMDEFTEVALASTPSRMSKGKSKFKGAVVKNVKKAKQTTVKKPKGKDTTPEVLIPKDASPASAMYIRMQFALDKEVAAAQVQESHRDVKGKGKHPRQKSSSKGAKGKTEQLDVKDSKARSPSPRGAKKGKKGKK